MHPDEEAIQRTIEQWLRATAVGDVHELLSLMAEDVVFLTPGQEPMRRDDFVAGFSAAVEHMRIDAHSEVQEIEVAGDWAYCWNYLDVMVTPRAAGAPTRRVGHVLTIFRRQNGGWVIARDANLLASGV
jgi:uncharacterized protein (TIGR02246 family)